MPQPGQVVPVELPKGSGIVAMDRRPEAFPIHLLVAGRSVGHGVAMIAWPRQEGKALTARTVRTQPSDLDLHA